MINKMILKMSGDAASPGNILTGNYTTPNNRLRILISESEFVEVPVSQKDVPVALVFKFDRKVSEYSFEYDMEANSEEDKKKKDVIEVFWKQHPLLTINGKQTSYTKTPMYDMYSEKQKTSESFDTWQMQVDVSNRVSAMSIDRLRDVMYYYGIDPSSYSKEQMVVKLAGANGKAVTDINPSTKENNFLKVWQEEGPVDREYLTNMKKALFHKIIDHRRDGNRNLYYFGDEFIGHAESDVLAYLKREVRIYESNIMPRIQDAEKNIYGTPAPAAPSAKGKAAEKAPTPDGKAAVNKPAADPLLG